MKSMNPHVIPGRRGARRAVAITTIAALVLLATGLGYALLALFLSGTVESDADAAGISSSFVRAAIIATLGVALAVASTVLRRRARSQAT